MLRYIPICGCFALLFASSSMAFDSKDIVTVQLDRPVWALGLGDATWLMPEKAPNSPSFAILSFSAEMRGVPKEGQEQKEDDIGRTSRALPLYLAERINLETACLSVNYNPVLKGSGPVVSGERTDGNSISSVFKGKHAFIVTGHFEKDYLNLSNKLTIYLYDTLSAKERPLVEITSIFQSQSDMASKAADEFFTKLGDAGICSFRAPQKQFPRPPKEFAKEYMDGLGQLFMQTLVQNDYVSKSSLWGEDNMLNWYVSLGKVMPEAATPRLMHLRGVLASFSYGTEAYKSHISGLSEYLMRLNDTNDPINRISPIFFHKVGMVKAFETKKRSLEKIKDEGYRRWLKRISEEKS